MTVVDVHTHMMTREWLALLAEHGGKYTVTADGMIEMDGTPFLPVQQSMWDYELRIQAMDEARVDVAVVSLTCPNVYWGDQATSLQAARIVNDSMAQQRRLRAHRIAWFASLPWQYPEAAIQELGRVAALGACGIVVLANIAGQDLIDPLFAPVWAEIDRLALPVLVHPTVPQGYRDQHLEEFALAGSVGFMADTTLAFAKIIYSGFIDRYPQLKLIASHGGGSLPYVAGRLDRVHEVHPAASAAIKGKPSDYLRRIHYDAVVYERLALDLCIAVAGEDNVLFGSDYPHKISDMAGSLARVRSLPSAQARKVLQTNAERLFKL